MTKIFKENISTFFEKIDILGPHIGYEHQFSTTFKSVQGGVYSFCVLLTAAVIGLMFSNELYERKKPISITNKESITYSKVDFKNFPVVFVASLHNSLSNIPYEYLESELYIFKVYQNSTFSFQTIYNPLYNCNPSKDLSFPNEESIKLFDKSFGEGFKCIRDLENYYFQNPYISVNSTLVGIKFKKCSKQSNPNCPDNVNELVDSTFIGPTFLNTYIDWQNYFNPIKYIDKSVIYQLGSRLHQTVRINIIGSYITTDYGWILEDKKLESSFLFQSLDYSFTIDDQGILKDYVASFFFVSENIKLNNIRSYMKVQELFAQLGGLANVLRIIFKIISFNHIRFTYLNYIFSLIINTNNKTNYNSNNLKKNLDCSNMSLFNNQENFLESSGILNENKFSKYIAKNYNNNKIKCTNNKKSQVIQSSQTLSISMDFKNELKSNKKKDRSINIQKNSCVMEKDKLDKSRKYSYNPSKITFDKKYNPINIVNSTSQNYIHSKEIYTGNNKLLENYTGFDSKSVKLNNFLLNNKEHISFNKNRINSSYVINNKEKQFEKINIDKKENKYWVYLLGHILCNKKIKAKFNMYHSNIEDIISIKKFAIISTYFN